jgi:hypothetical protein
MCGEHEIWPAAVGRGCLIGFSYREWCECENVDNQSVAVTAPMVADNNDRGPDHS